MPSVRLLAAWETIETELRDQFPDVRETLAPPAQLAEVDQIEQICDLALPEDFRASLLRHNGQSGSNWMRGLVVRLVPLHRGAGSHVPYDSLIELRAAYMPDAARSVSGHPPS